MASPPEGEKMVGFINDNVGLMFIFCTNGSCDLHRNFASDRTDPKVSLANNMELDDFSSISNFHFNVNKTVFFIQFSPDIKVILINIRLNIYF